MEKEELPLETRCKMAGMKMMARWLLGLKVLHKSKEGEDVTYHFHILFSHPLWQDDSEDELNSSNSGVTISAQKTFRMLNAVIDTKGDLLEEKKPR